MKKLDWKWNAFLALVVVLLVFMDCSWFVVLVVPLFWIPSK